MTFCLIALLLFETGRKKKEKEKKVKEKEKKKIVK